MLLAKWWPVLSPYCCEWCKIHVLWASNLNYLSCGLSVRSIAISLTAAIRGRQVYISTTWGPGGWALWCYCQKRNPGFFWLLIFKQMWCIAAYKLPSTDWVRVFLLSWNSFSRKSSFSPWNFHTLLLVDSSSIKYTMELYLPMFLWM